MKKAMYKLIQNNSGLAIIQGLIIAALVAGASAMVVNYTSQQQKSAKKSQGASAANVTVDLINNILLTKTFCDRTIEDHPNSGALNAAGGVLDNLVIKDSNGTVIVQSGMNIRGVRINNISLQYPGNAAFNAFPGAGGGTFAPVTQVTINLSYGLLNEQLTVNKVIAGTNLPIIRKVGADFRECLHNATGDVTGAVQQNCERIGGTFVFDGESQCLLDNLGNPIEGTNQNAAGYSITATGLERAQEYLDNRFLRLDTGGIFQPGKGMTVGTLTVTNPGSTPSSLVNIRQLRQSIQNYCIGSGGLGVFAANGLTCVSLACPAGSYLSGVNQATGQPDCRALLANGSGCPNGEFYQFQANGSGQVVLNCCQPNPSDPVNPHICDPAVTNAYDLGTVFPNPNGCGTCIGTRTNVEYTCLLGNWVAGGACGTTNSALCSGGSGVQGDIACCAAAPTSTCTMPTPTYSSYTCSGGSWSGAGASCSGPNSPQCFGGPGNDGDVACCSSAPTTMCGVTLGASCTNGAACTFDSDCGSGTCSGGTSGSSCYTSNVTPSSPNTKACFALVSGDCAPCNMMPDAGACSAQSGYYDPNTMSEYTCSWGGSSTSCVCPSFSTYTCNAGSWSGAGGSCAGPDSGGCSGGSTADGSSVCCSSAPTGTCQGGSGAMGRYECGASGWFYSMAEFCPSDDAGCSSGTHSNGDNFCCNTTPTSTCGGSTPPPPNGVCRTYSGSYSSQPASNDATGCTLGEFRENPANTATEWRWFCDGTVSTDNCSATRAASVPGTCRSYPDPMVGQTGHSCTDPSEISCNYGGTGSYSTGYTGGFNNCEAGPTCSPGGNLNPPASGGSAGGYTYQPGTSDATGCTSGSYSDAAETSSSPWRWNCGSTLCEATRTQKVFFDNTPFNWTANRVYDSSGNLVSGATESSCPSSLNGQERYLVRQSSSLINGEWYVARCNGSGWSRSRGCSSSDWCGDNTSPTDEITATQATRYLRP